MLASFSLSAQAILLITERDGERCAGPVLMAGFVVGFGVIELSTNVLSQTSRFSLELLVLLVFQLIGPILVSVLAMALLLPRWLERVVQQGQKAWRQSVPAAGLVGLLLMLLFFVAAIVGGVLVTPRADLLRETTELLSGIRFRDLLRTLVRSGVFLSCICAWCQWRALTALRSGRSEALIVSNLLVEGLMLALALKLVWVLVFNTLAQ
ncbi:hypothetical protein SynWH8101_0817 [Synechococcus sp. WH 8101]|uniref:hypothetical protein n=1 Tax=Synechococcus sp. WH 8101 TaxID=59932 RepID=UPI001024138E|nr:hypothetical protein [Synechococcus sp. WH 8101]QBE68407.1 hypothetical protein SynWH8101_0817 [Synechococcus sp. WH 8101]QNI44621.1 hypothetical protein SynRCC2555_00833 [Synechococcus sp. WH 8101]